MKTALLHAAALCSVLLCTSVSAKDISSFPIGKQWPDNNGEHINCHGGCVVEYDGDFYWFGESRTGGHSDGISVYRSKDLYNWDNLGFAVVHQGERDDENMQDISEGRLLERPKVIYNQSTGKWVMWAHWENGKDYGQARVAVLQSDKITGPYEFVQTMRPNGHDSRDQTLFLDTDGKAYHFCSTNMNTDINVVRLSDDFLNCSDDETLIMKGRKLEATTVCKVGDTYFATFSECKGWDPAPGHTATSIGDILGSWTEGLSFCVDPDANRSYGSQGAYVFSVGSLGYDPKCFIFYGDRWIPSNVGGSTYVWLPMSVRSGYPVIRNYPETWSLDEVMTDMYRFKRAENIADGMEMALLERNSDRFLSRLGKQAGFCIANDNDTKNVTFAFESTSDPNVWRLRDKATGKYLSVNRGQLREDADGNSTKSMWRFFRVADGYYNIVNEECRQCLTVVGGSRADGAEIGLEAVGAGNAQAFGVYFDSKQHAYKEADMFSKKYFEDIAKEIATQPSLPQGSTLPFEMGKPFVLIHAGSGRALTFETDNNQNRRAMIVDFSHDMSQKMTFTATAADSESDGYNIADGNGNYLIKDGNWNSSWASDAELTGKNAIFQIEEGNGYYLIKCSANNKYLGTDSSANGSLVFTDKTGEGRQLSYWVLADFDNTPLVTPTEKFYEQLDKADIMLALIPEEFCGRGAFDYSIDARAALAAAFEHALNVTSDYDSETKKLSDAIAKFEAEKIIAPTEGQPYILQHVSGLHFVYAKEGVPMLGESADTNHDRFLFVSNNDNTYGLVNLLSGMYAAGGTPNRWNMHWSEKGDSKNAKWTVEVSQVGKKVIKNMQTGGYIGCDTTEAGSSLWCDKGSDNNNSQWSIIETEAASISQVTPDSNQVICLPVTGGIKVCGASCHVTVHNMTGHMIATADGTNMHIALAPGIYIVSTHSGLQSESFKIAVK